MKIYTIILVMIIAVPISTYCGDCGTMDGFWDAILTDNFIPDEFPPEETLDHVVTGGMYASCYPFGIADWSASCRQHDVCFDDRLKSRDECDQDLINGWISACNSQFEWFPPCRRACKSLAYTNFSAMQTFNTRQFSKRSTANSVITDLILED